MDVKGDKEIIRALQEFGRKLSGQVVRRAGQKAMTPVAKAARGFAKPASKTVAKSIGGKVKVYKQTGYVLAIVGPKADPPKSVKLAQNAVIEGSAKRKRVHDPSKTAHLVHGGTKAHKITLFKKRQVMVVDHPGMKGVPYLYKALAQAEGLAKQIYINELRTGLRTLSAQLDKSR